MRTLNFRYHLKIEFDKPVTHHSFTVKCVPQTDERQNIISRSESIIPNKFLNRDKDSFGNIYYFGKEDEPHNLFEVTSQGVAVTGLSKGVKAEEDYRLGMFLKQTQFTHPDDKLKEFFKKIRLKDGESNLYNSLCIMEKLGESFRYVSGSTNIHTTASQAWSQGCGVCQDYSHIMISLCRMAGIQARYVAGMLVGEGASHAWLEIADNGMWYGLDPTNGTQVGDEHIKISHGRDYKDCLINQGVFNGDATQRQTVSVVVHEAH